VSEEAHRGRARRCEKARVEGKSTGQQAVMGAMLDSRAQVEVLELR
jgi:hypothetical protein